jgi:transcription elongation factor/antiterminator RfaH
MSWREISAASKARLCTLDSPLAEGERWYVVHTLPHREQSAQHHLDAQGFRTFLPRYRKTLRHARSLKTVFAPLFSRYLFIVLHLRRDRWRSVNGTYGVATLVMQRENPLPVLRGAVEALLASATSTGIVAFSPEMQPGQPVRFIAGPFAEHLGILEHLSNSGRVRVLLEMMNGRIPVELQRSDVVPLSPSSNKMLR